MQQLFFSALVWSHVHALAQLIIFSLTSAVGIYVKPSMTAYAIEHFVS